MSPELEEFRLRLLAHAKQAVSRAPRADSEAKTNAYLVQPFFTTLGYDVGNQNKVDYAILHNGAPVIALETKRVGAAKKDDIGQLKSYFNACQSVKLGVLTDGLKYEFFADADKPNMMDDAAFLRLDLSEVAKNGGIDDNTLGGVAALRKGFFNPENVGAEAKQKLLFESIVETLKKFKSDPSDDFIKFILGCSVAGSKIGRMTPKIVDENRDVVRSAMEAFVAQEALARFGYAPKDVVRTQPETPPTVIIPAPAEPEAEAASPSGAEVNAFNYTKNRLYYLVRNDVLFLEVQKIAFRKTKASFRVYYARPNNGSLFDCKEQKDSKILLQFPALGGDDVAFEPSARLDDCLLKAFVKRVTEAGVSFDSSPVLHAIQGGQSPSAA